MIDNYLQLEQPNTGFNLYERIRTFDDEKNNEILVTIDGSNFTQQDFQYIQQLSEIIQDSGEIGEFELNNLKLDITDLTTFEKKLIVCE